MGDIDIIPALGEHIDDIMAIEKASFKMPWLKETFIREILYNDLSVYFAAVANGVIVGYTGMRVMLDEGHIMNIAVHPEYRRKGIGQLLIERLIQHAWENDIQALTLEVSVSNTAAIKLYQRNGFQINGLRKRYYSNEDAYIMWLIRNDKKTIDSRGTYNAAT